MIQPPLQCTRLKRLTWRENNRIISVPFRIHICPVGGQQLLPRNPRAHQRGTHQRPVAALAHIRSVVDHPLGHCQPRRSRRLPRYPALGDPSERAVFLVAKRSAMQLGILRHQGFHETKIVRVDGQLQFGCFMREGRKRFHVGLEFWPAEESVAMGNLELSHGRNATWPERFGAVASFFRWRRSGRSGSGRG